MGKRTHILGSACNTTDGLIGVLGWLLRFARLMLVAETVLAGRLLAAESQLAACVNAMDRKKAPKPRFKLSFRLLWAFVIVKLVGNWRELSGSTW